MKRQIVLFSFGVASFTVAWYLASLANPSFFPPPGDVVQSAYQLIVAPDVDGNTALYHLWASLVRIGIITAVALTISIVLGIAMGSVTSIETPMSNLIPFWMALPPLVIILFSMTLLGFTEQTIIIAVLVATTPYGVVNVWKGTKNIDPDLLEMGDVFGVSRFSMWRNIYFPAVLPYLFSTGRYLFSMIWKVTMLAEVFGVDRGIGARVRFWFDQADLTLLLAYFFIFFVTLLLIEYGIIAQLEKRAFKWRPESESTI